MVIKCLPSKVIWGKIHRYHVWNYEEVRVQGMQPVRYISVQQPQQAAFLTTFQNIKWLNTTNEGKFCIPVNSLKVLHSKSSMNPLPCSWADQSLRTTFTAKKVWVLLYPPELQLFFVHNSFILLMDQEVIRGLNSPCNLSWWNLGSGKKAARGTRTTEIRPTSASQIWGLGYSCYAHHHQHSPSLQWWRVNRHEGTVPLLIIICWSLTNGTR